MLRTTAVLIALSVALPNVAGGADIRFNRDIRPILSDKCSKCHGPDESHREAELRLDEEAGVRYAFDGGLDESEGWLRVTSDDPELVMPPPDSHVELSEDELDTLRSWVRDGARWEGHWSFISPRRPGVPAPDSDAAAVNWIRNPIDSFVLAKLHAHGLTPNADADRELLLRRVTLDLTGLPPSIDQIDEFLADSSASAYEKVIDRLLNSPHFGERMAVMWMDAARYGDTSVFHADGVRDMWPWRDWVINAYNSNKPFDEFTREQLAGDLIPDAETDQTIASGFLRNNATTDEGGLIEEEYRVEYAVDRVKTTSMVWMGLSMECAQCHNHKYDPITQEEYYRFFAYFNQAADPGRQTRNGNQAPVVDLFDNEKLAQADRLQTTLTSLEGQLADRSVNAESEFQVWLADASEQVESRPLLPPNPVVYLPLDETEGKSVTDAANPDQPGKIRGPGSWAAGHIGNAFRSNGRNHIDLGNAGNFDGSTPFSYGCWIRPRGAGTGVPVSRMNNANAFRGYDIFLADGAVSVHIIHSWPDNGIKVTTREKLRPDAWQHIFVTFDASGKAAGIKVYVDGDEKECDVERDGLTGSITSAGPFFVGRRNSDSVFNGLVDEVRVYDRLLSGDDVAALAGSSEVDNILVKAAKIRTDDEHQTLRTHFLTKIDESYQQLAARRDKLNAQVTALRKPSVNVMVMQDVPQMRDTFVLQRGNYASPLADRKVMPGVPAALPALPSEARPNRLGLADWLTSSDHPLTARVAVNRYWSMFFGEGIVRSLEDFGAQGEWPSHPELLDWLAVDFVESGWDIQRAIKQILMSSTYRQSSSVSAEKLAADPQNRWLSHAPRFRLQAEFVRDNALAASGLIVHRIGGPGVKPYQPAGLWNEVSLDGNLTFVQDHGENLFRRSMYTYWRRSAPAPSMTIFDAPTREKCVLRRSRTNTPLQALVTLNDVQFVEAARSLAEIAIKQGGTADKDRIEFAFRRVTGTRPNQHVHQILVDAWHDELARFTKDTEAAKRLISIGESQRDESLNPAVHAAMTVIASLILNLDQTLTRS